MSWHPEAGSIVELGSLGVKTVERLRRLHSKLFSQVYLPYMGIVQHVLGSAGGDDLPLTHDVGFLADIKGVTHIVIRPRSFIGHMGLDTDLFTRGGGNPVAVGVDRDRLDHLTTWRHAAKTDHR